MTTIEAAVFLPEGSALLGDLKCVVTVSIAAPPSLCRPSQHVQRRSVCQRESAQSLDKATPMCGGVCGNRYPSTTRNGQHTNGGRCGSIVVAPPSQKRRRKLSV